jgi:hypothetical protein
MDLMTPAFDKCGAWQIVTGRQNRRQTGDRYHPQCRRRGRQRKRGFWMEKQAVGWY